MFLLLAGYLASFLLCQSLVSFSCFSLESSCLAVGQSGGLQLCRVGLQLAKVSLICSGDGITEPNQNLQQEENWFMIRAEQELPSQLQCKTLAKS